MFNEPLDRRTALKLLGAGAGAFSAFGPMQAAGASAAGGSDWLPDGGADGWRHTVRMQGSTRQEDVLWWYTGRIYAQVGVTAPRHLFNLEGTEIYWYRELDDGSFLISSRTLTFFRDKDTGEMIRRYENPYTGKIVEADANRLGGRENMRKSADGWEIVFGDMGVETSPWQLEWHRAGDLAWFTSSRFGSFMPQPWLESMTVFCPLDALQDMSQANLPTHFSSTYLAPFPAWMQMGDLPGHAVWHSSGRKIASPDEISDEYRRRVDAEYGGVLTANPDSFD